MLVITLISLYPSMMHGAAGILVESVRCSTAKRHGSCVTTATRVCCMWAETRCLEFIKLRRSNEDLILDA